MHCSVAQCLEVVGRVVVACSSCGTPSSGVTRFDEFQERLGISRNVLNQRLARLVEAGVLVKVPYSEHPPRYDYRLTDKGRDLWPVLTAMRQWGDKYAAPDGPPLAGGPQGLRADLRGGRDLLDLRGAGRRQGRPAVQGPARSSLSWRRATGDRGAVGQVGPVPFSDGQLARAAGARMFRRRGQPRVDHRRQAQRRLPAGDVGPGRGVGGRPRPCDRRQRPLPAFSGSRPGRRSRRRSSVGGGPPARYGPG